MRMLRRVIGARCLHEQRCASDAETVEVEERFLRRYVDKFRMAEGAPFLATR